MLGSDPPPSTSGNHKAFPSTRRRIPCCSIVRRTLAENAVDGYDKADFGNGRGAVDVGNREEAVPMSSQLRCSIRARRGDIGAGVSDKKFKEGGGGVLGLRFEHREQVAACAELDHLVKLVRRGEYFDDLRAHRVGEGEREREGGGSRAGQRIKAKEVHEMTTRTGVTCSSASLGYQKNNRIHLARKSQ